jgi:Type II CAAX prenyl endopeptidase Rce1-like
VTRYRREAGILRRPPGWKFVAGVAADNTLRSRKSCCEPYREFIEAELAKDAGEEIGWRGLLVPALVDAYGERKAALLSGIVRALWHLPLVIFGTYRRRNSVSFSAWPSRS